jgi:hypothetical protein
MKEIKLFSIRMCYEVKTTCFKRGSPLDVNGDGPFWYPNHADAPPNSLIDSTANPNVKTVEG